MKEDTKKLCISYLIKAVKAVLPIASAFLASLLAGTVAGGDATDAVLTGAVVGNILKDIG